VLHAKVLRVLPGRQLRLSGGLGPLQALPVSAILDITLTPEREGTRVLLTYHVGGPASADLGRLAPLVDAILADALARLLVHVPRPGGTAGKEAD